MSHQYDSGLATSQYKAIRDAIKARLEPLVRTPVGGLYARAIATLPKVYAGGENDDALLANALLDRAPAFGIVLNTMRFKPEGGAGTELDAELDIRIYAVSEHATDVTEGRLYEDAAALADVHADPGVFTMLEHARQLLAGAELGIDTVESPLRIESQDEVLTVGNVTVWEQRYNVQVNASVNPARAGVLVTQIQGKHTADGTDPVPHQLAPLETLTDLDEPEDDEED